MSGFQCRGYMVSTTAEYLRMGAAERDVKGVFDHVSPPLREALGNIKHAGWYPIAFCAELNNLIASTLAGGDEEQARREFEKAGKFMAREATNTFLRLLMRMLTPALFAKKLPDLWKRDCSGGRLDVAVDNDLRKLTCRMSEMDGYDHLAAMIPGYVGFALESMGNQVDKATVHGWSLKQPNASGAVLEITWK